MKGKRALAFLIVTCGSIVMLAVAMITAFQCPRLYRETLLSMISKAILNVYGLKLRFHQEYAFPDRQVIYVSNHTSSIDIFVLAALRLPNARFFLSGYLRKVMPFGIIGYIVGTFWTVPQTLTEERRRIFQRADRVLRRTGESVYLSPEGKRVTSGRVGPFNKGAFHLATALGAPIIPLFIRIPQDIDPGRGLDAKPGTIDLFVMPSIDTSSWSLEDLIHNKEKVRDMFVEWHGEIIGGHESPHIP